MALSTTPGYASFLRRVPRSSGDSTVIRSSIPFQLARGNLRFRKPLCVRASSVAAPASSGTFAPAITLTEKALTHLNKMRIEKNEDLCLRIGVKQGGCSGMSYTMEFENRSNSKEGDSIIEYNGFTIVCDPKSLLFVFGMQLDFSDALIGGGFSFKNPNATKTCGCGKSFASGMSNEVEAEEGDCSNV